MMAISLAVRAGVAAWATLLCGALAAGPAAAATYVYNETSASVPGFLVDASITIDGNLADLPTLSNLAVQPPYNFAFGRLEAFTITVPKAGGQNTYTLADFTGECQFPANSVNCPSSGILGFPQWSISPAGISFIDRRDESDFLIKGFGTSGTIEFESDGPTLPPACMRTGACVATGSWDLLAAVPEAPSATFLAAALVALPLAVRRRLRPRTGGARSASLQ